ncbi:hypothetical protein AA23498_3057 [Acetobacter nitrogenifigens DSM 23921 = NBRC 105050]|uniref:Resolvase/invertase-type recombinase catalytic domain-containing protein n=1 Tax=Acetobacter nitrogenifigens DSM 23921 = NBRC 105050 TaxID=1120919 RepID=A0A511X9Y6_9PROT|nr:recombinase family protein [Acetobacter nitrogenifigens]GBQ97990.1 hypothetical protein AA23498_3057 [Acetobacter nitrogenifigens DSM 23921 = NBRC 105050]GEN59735.1 hypothetical protein ANI02nite_16190 [Acetobacter nitrogenifigens DSM 23921 = NBRC 105050]
MSDCFFVGLEKVGVEFVAADMPNANRLTVSVMALVAQQEREAISARANAALALQEPMDRNSTGIAY